MTDFDFQEQRTTILKSFLSRPAIYQTEWFNARLEERARDNIAKALAGTERSEDR